MISPVALALFSLLFLWLAVLSFLLWKMYTYYSFLTKGTDKKTLPAILESVLRDTHTTRKALGDLAKRCDTMEKESQFHIQKIGLLRFNPFKDTGGDQSFILTLVDANDTGVIISGLYSRSGTRWYAKKLVKGRGFEHELSDEEKKALKLAQPISHQ
jgi:hypothetical protein